MNAVQTITLNTRIVKIRLILALEKQWQCAILSFGSEGDLMNMIM